MVIIWWFYLIKVIHKKQENYINVITLAYCFRFRNVFGMRSITKSYKTKIIGFGWFVKRVGLNSRVLKQIRNRDFWLISDFLQCLVVRLAPFETPNFSHNSD